MKREDEIAGLLPAETQMLRKLFEAEPTVSEVILYGSRAKGTHRPGSDIDLTLKGEGLSMVQMIDLSSKIDDLLLPYEVDLSIFGHIDNPDLTDHILRGGKVVFSRE